MVSDTSTPKQGVRAHLLQHPTAIHLLGKTMNLSHHLKSQSLLLTLVTVDEEPLHHVVAKDIAHQLAGVG